ncbi:MAG: hypothetical protein ACRD4H_02705 [Candidatus Acidiferrales bacterium]
MCLRGASAVEEFLAGFKNPRLEVLVVWEPILPTDWQKPTSGTLARISDPRAAQFWDPNHVVAREINQDSPPSAALPEPHCCQSRGFYWDMALIYPPNAVWTTKLPSPQFRDGTVVRVTPELAKLLPNIAR